MATLRRSSKYGRHQMYSSANLLTVNLISLVNTRGAMFRPKGMALNLQFWFLYLKPRYGRNVLATDRCQKPSFRSIEIVQAPGEAEVRGRYQFMIPTRWVPTCVLQKFKIDHHHPNFGIDTNPFWPIFKKKAYPPSIVYEYQSVIIESIL